MVGTFRGVRDFNHRRNSGTWKPISNNYKKFDGSAFKWKHKSTNLRENNRISRRNLTIRSILISYFVYAYFNIILMLRFNHQHVCKLLPPNRKLFLYTYCHFSAIITPRCIKLYSLNVLSLWRAGKVSSFLMYWPTSQHPTYFATEPYAGTSKRAVVLVAMLNK